jgi:putative glutamine amidotransferase
MKSQSPTPQTYKRPLIGITCSRMPGPAWGRYEPGSLVNYVFEDYVQAVDASGGIPLVIPVIGNPDVMAQAIDHLHGLILTGGPDILPRFYGQSPAPNMGEVDYALDCMELEAAKEARRRRIPILGICRGIQTLAVAFGGTLIQDIPSQLPGSVDHFQKAAKNVASHPVQVIAGTRLHGLLQRDVVWVNSKHHQSVRDIPQGFVRAAESEDGIVEAIESSSGPFILGVQWHPEGMWQSDEAARSLFSNLIAEAAA